MPKRIRFNPSEYRELNTAEQDSCCTKGGDWALDALRHNITLRGDLHHALHEIGHLYRTTARVARRRLNHRVD